MSEENSNQPINNAAELQQRYASGERDFKKANLAKADLRDTDLRGADLQGANLEKANLRGANLKEANLQLANLKECDLRGANLNAANLKGAYLCGAYLELTMLQKANLQGANLRGGNMSGTMLMGASLEKADLTFADFSDTYTLAQGGSGGANLEGANLSGANLKGAYLKGANLNGASLKAAELKGANLQGAYYDGKTYFPAGFDPASVGMQKSRNGSKASSSSARNLKPVFIISAVGCVGVVLAPVAIFQTWAEASKSNTTPTSTAKGEIDDKTLEASIPAGPDIDDKTLEASIPAGPDIDDKTLEASLPAAKGEIDEKSLGANKPAVKPQIQVTLKANSSKPAPTPEANKPKSAPTADVKSKSQAASAAKPAGVTPTSGAMVASCPALVRAINAANPDQPSAVDIIVNGKKVLSNVPFSQASRYISVSSGKLSVQIMKAGTKTMVGERTFAAAPNSAYSVAVTGPLQGPRGQVLFNKSPFVIPEDLSPPSPGKFKGGWYKLSETKAENDLRIAKSGAPNVAQAQLVDVIPKTAVDYSELKAGTYNFNTVLPNKSDTIVNKAYKPAMRVEIAKANIPAGTIFDVFATGNTLGKGHNSLKLSAASYKTLPPTASGCTKVQ